MNLNNLVGQFIIIVLIGVGLGFSAQAWLMPDFGPLLGEGELHGASDELIEAVKKGDVTGPANLIFIEGFDRILSSDLYDMGRPGPADDVYFIDARGVGSYEAGHIPGAYHIDAEAVTPGGSFGETVLPRIPQGHSVVVYCGGGTCDLSKRLGRALIQRGYKKIFIYEGGWDDWTQQGAPSAEGSMEMGR